MAGKANTQRIDFTAASPCVASPTRRDRLDRARVAARDVIAPDALQLSPARLTPLAQPGALASKADDWRAISNGSVWLGFCTGLGSMKTFKLRLEQALSSGAALAMLGSGTALAVLTLPACSSDEQHGSNGGASGSSGATGGKAGGGAGNAGEGGAGAANAGEGGAGAAGSAGAAGDGEGGDAGASAGAAGEGNQPLAPYPVNTLGCSGPEHNDGYLGQCCATALCYTPDDGSECVAPDAAPGKLGKFYGSGSCLCGPSIQGPFAKNPTHEPTMAGTCCYVVSAITCEGRPLLVDGIPLISSLTQRGDWLSPDLLELLA